MVNPSSLTYWNSKWKPFYFLQWLRVFCTGTALSYDENSEEQWFQDSHELECGGGELQSIPAKQKIDYSNFDSISVDFNYFLQGLYEYYWKVAEKNRGGENVIYVNYVSMTLI